MVGGKPEVEILYFTSNEDHVLKIGLFFSWEWLHKIVDMIYGKEMMKSTWMLFMKTGNMFVFIRKAEKECFQMIAQTLCHMTDEPKKCSHFRSFITLRVLHRFK